MPTGNCVRSVLVLCVVTTVVRLPVSNRNSHYEWPSGGPPQVRARCALKARPPCGNTWDFASGDHPRPYPDPPPRTTLRMMMCEMSAMATPVDCRSSKSTLHTTVTNRHKTSDYIPGTCRAFFRWNVRGLSTASSRSRCQQPGTEHSIRHPGLQPRHFPRPPTGSGSPAAKPSAAGTGRPWIRTG